MLDSVLDPCLRGELVECPVLAHFGDFTSFSASKSKGENGLCNVVWIGIGRFRVDGVTTEIPVAAVRPAFKYAFNTERSVAALGSRGPAPVARVADVSHLTVTKGAPLLEAGFTDQELTAAFLRYRERVRDAADQLIATDGDTVPDDGWNSYQHVLHTLRLRTPHVLLHPELDWRGTPCAYLLPGDSNVVAAWQLALFDEAYRWGSRKPRAASAYPYLKGVPPAAPHRAADADVAAALSGGTEISDDAVVRAVALTAALGRGVGLAVPAETAQKVISVPQLRGPRRRARKAMDAALAERAAHPWMIEPVLVPHLDARFASSVPLQAQSRADLLARWLRDDEGYRFVVALAGAFAGTWRVKVLAEEQMANFATHRFLPLSLLVRDPEPGPERRIWFGREEEVVLHRHRLGAAWRVEASS